MFLAVLRSTDLPHSYPAHRFTGQTISWISTWDRWSTHCINLFALPLKYSRFYHARKPYVSIKVLGNSFPVNFLYTISYTHRKESLYIYIWKHCASIENSFILLSRLPTPIRVFFLSRERNFGEDLSLRTEMTADRSMWGIHYSCGIGNR